MRTRMLKWGNSLAVRIPKAVSDEANLTAGDTLELQVAPDGSLQLHRIGRVPTLAQLVAQITPENLYEEISTGTEIGKEDVEW